MLPGSACTYPEFLAHSPSSKISRDSPAILTNPCARASARTACVETTSCIFANEASQILGSLHRSTLSDPVRSLTRTDGRLVVIDAACCSHRATVGARNQINFGLVNGRSTGLQYALLTFPGVRSNSVCILSSALRQSQPCTSTLYAAIDRTRGSCRFQCPSRSPLSCVRTNRESS